ncbi:ATPase [Thiocapsa imhoffii]|uniref:ATPase n=1 Tax=Thiocapsa imhoffii TaxID=382777 RepID=A0A9X1B8E3_9GAMM|nr:DUF87 domain-containing protein [Thiocapsa imhoffii]MBK1644809.1 ATPase [Thiocapsa imhoffii]
MNLFVASLADDLVTEWDRVLGEQDGPKEARFIIQSLSPLNAFDLFAALENHRGTWSARARIESHFKVATNLWEDWRRGHSQAELLAEMNARGAPRLDEPQGWIDLGDQLTWYRNRTRTPQADGLVIVLLGLNHASDQGGLANFHILDESRLWQRMERGFASWIERIDQHYGLSASTTEKERFDAILQDLFQTRPLQLERLSGFLQHQVLGDGDGIDAFSDVIELFYAKLSFWEIPPFFGLRPDRKNAGLLKEAATFISHQRFKTKGEQKKAWEKIEQALEQDQLDLPNTLDDLPLYDSPKAYAETLRAFIQEADSQARARLLQTDLAPVLRLLKLKTKDTEKGVSRTPVRLQGLSLESVLRAIWLTLLAYRKRDGNRALMESLREVHIELVDFKHDLQADEEAGLGRDTQARELLHGCLGGLPEVLEQIDWRLPIDADQMAHPRDDWEQSIPVTLDLDLEALSYGTNRGRPHLHFKVVLIDEEGGVALTRPYHWSLGPTQPERVRRQCARTVLERWNALPNPERVLPAFQIPAVVMTALYYAADTDEANRLVSLALNELEVVDLLAGLTPDLFDRQLWDGVIALAAAYRAWLSRADAQGNYAANAQDLLPLLGAYRQLAQDVLNPHLRGSHELLRRLYKAFLVVDEAMVPNDDFLRSAIVWAISPPVLELTLARQRFLCDGFPEVVAELAFGRDGQSAFEQLLKLAEIHRPLAGLVVDANHRLCAEIKSFGLLHHLGLERDGEKSLAVQTLLREEESDDDDEVADLVRPTEESEVVLRVLEDYLQLYPFAEDGMRILALHVEELGTILSGVDRFLRAYLKRSARDWPAFHCEVMVYSTSASPMAMESRLAAWRHRLAEANRESGRPLVLAVGHRFAPDRERMVELLKQERRLYDIAFLFHFLAGDLAGEAEPAKPFEFDFNGSNIGQFPICEFPRPIRRGDPWRRQSLLSNRRLGVQTRHADLTARLCHPQTTHQDHLIFGRIDYEPWQPVVEALHTKAQWVACIDPFVDKHLLRTGEGAHNRRKIVGFTSGLGDYGELNLSISTEQDTLAQLARLVRGQLSGLMPYQEDQALDVMGAQVVSEAEEVIGLSALRAVVGDGERVREVVGFAAIRRALAVPAAAMSQLLPVDSLLHWFAGSEVSQRPDLLQLSLILREQDVPLVQAVVIECKFAQYNATHLEKASGQVQEGLAHLMPLLAPNRNDLRRVSFDRRYWWAQLQRTVTSRAVVDLSEVEWRKLDLALEKLSEGYYEIAWQGAIFTFWTNEPGAEPVLNRMKLPFGVVEPPFVAPDDFVVWHIALGYEGLAKLFGETEPADRVALGETQIRLRPTDPGVTQTETETEIVPEPETGPDSSQVESSQADDNVAPEVRHDKLVTAEVVSIRSGQRVSSPPGDSQRESRLDPESGAASGAGSAYEHSHERDTGLEPERLVAETIITPRPVPERILIGTRSNGEPVYWHYGHPDLLNRHLLAFGSPGSGKTYGIQCLLAEMAVQGLHSLIIDYTDGFLPKQVETRFTEIAKPKSHYVVHDKLPLNPFRRQQQEIDPDLPPYRESPYDVATRIASIFKSVYETMGDQQLSALIRVIESQLGFHHDLTIQKVLAALREDSQYGDQLANKIEPFSKSEPFREGSESAWEEMLSDPDARVQILQLKGLSKEIQRLVTEFVLWDLYDYATTTGNRRRPIPVVLDEIQNLDHRSDSPIDKMLREGRKFGLSMILATQTTSQFNQEQRDRLFMAAHKLFFKPAETEIDRFATLLSQSTGDSKAEWSQRLAKLSKGQCWSLGAVPTSSGGLQTKAIRVQVTALEDRGFGRGD